MFNEKDINRFWSQVNKTNDCWLWTGRKASTNEGEFTYYRESKYHYMSIAKVSYYLTTGVMDSEKDVVRLCGDPNCVNPNHLYLSNKKIHVDTIVIEEFEKRFPPETSTNLPLDALGKRYVKAKYRKNLADLRNGFSKKYGVALSNILSALSGDTWNHVD